MRVGRVGAAGVALLAVLLPYVAGAQTPLDIPGIGGALSISVSPPSRAPRETLTLTATSAFLDLSQSFLSWRVGGATVSKGVGNSSIQVTLGDEGSVTSVEVSALSPDGTAAAASASLRPATIDLLVDSDSYAPPFYRGRRMPSPGTNLLLEAVAHFVRGNGTTVAPSEISYTWKRNGTTLGNLSGPGRSFAVMASPPLFGADTISVEAVSLDGTFSAEASGSVASVDPGVALYEDHPLYGLMYWRALSAQNAVPDSEMAFAAVPYFAQATSPDDPRLSYEWQVNGRHVPSSDTAPSKLTINAQGSTGVADIALTVSHSSNILMRAAGSWTVTLRGGTGKAGGNDLFHAGVR